MSAYKPKVSILLRKTRNGSYDSAHYRKTRFDQRQRIAKEMGLNFRYEGYPVREHGIRVFLKIAGFNTTRTGTCLVCSQRADQCSCKIEVTPLKLEV